MALLAASGAHGEILSDLRDDYRHQQVELPGKEAKRRQARAADCQKVISEFSGYDRFKSPIGWKVYGVDLRGWIWLVASNSDGSCALKKYGRLDRLDYSIERDGTRQWRIFHYEDQQLCLYSRAGQFGRVRKTCHEPIDGVPRFAPYFLH